MPRRPVKREEDQPTGRGSAPRPGARTRAGAGADRTEAADEPLLHQMQLEEQNSALRDAQAELESSRDRYASLYDLAPVGYATLDAKGIIREANLALGSMVRSDRLDLLGKPFLLLVGRTHKEAFLQLLWRCQMRTDRQSAELALRAGAGRTAVVQAVMQKALQPAASEHYLLALVDITEKVQAEKASRETQARLDDALQASNMVVWSLDLSTREVTQSGNAHAVLGVAPGTAYRVHRELLDDIHVDDRPRHREAVRKALEARSAYSVQYRVLCQAGGDLRWFEEHGKVIADEAGEPRLLRGVLFNITERKQLEETLSAGYHRILSFIAESSDPLLLMDRTGVVECISRRGAALLGFEPRDLQGQQAAAFVHSVDLRLAGQQGEVVRRENRQAGGILRVRQKQGGWAWLDVRASLVLPGDPGSGYVVRFEKIEMDLPGAEPERHRTP